MDIGLAVRYVFDDENWVAKIGIGAIVTILAIFIIPIPFLIGWGIAVTRNVSDGIESPLPEWQDWGKLFNDGLKVLVAQFVYTLPVWLLSCFVTLGAIGISSGDDALAAIGGISLFLVSCLIVLVAIALAFLSPAIIIQYVRNGDDFAACFRFGEVFGIARQNFGDILVTFLVAWVAGLVVGLAAVVPILGWLVALAGSPYLLALSSHLYGQILSKMDGKQVKAV